MLQVWISRPRLFEASERRSGCQGYPLILSNRTLRNASNSFFLFLYSVKKEGYLNLIKKGRVVQNTIKFIQD